MGPADPSTAVTGLEPGLWVHRGGVPAMTGYHRHDDLEINVVLAGQLEYLFGGERLIVPPGHTALFWAAAPHRLINPHAEAATQTGGDVCWIHVPLRTALRWSLPPEFGTRVLGQQTVVVPTATLGDHVVTQFGTWQRDVQTGEGTEALFLEANALVLRILAHDAAQSDVVPPSAGGSRPGSALQPVAAMAKFTAARFRDPISPADIAGAVGLNPNYATTLFRESVGITLGEHLLRHRIAEAQRLLITTHLTTTTVAHAAGFGSASSLYAHFTRACGCPPGEYRRSRTTERLRPVT
ncbi:MAG TPA: helix-turn-helix domain-containing protein [Microlunatus sp.]|nr:helix-turn-helix domain-containing protein [Microlunatus sp.]